MRIDKNLAVVHAYLCADGYVIKNPIEQRHKYYNIGFRNTNIALLRDFQEKFEKVFGIKPYLIEGQRCRIGSRKIYEKLTKQFGSFYSWEWKMPKIGDNLLRVWLRAYFDCEGWVICKRHQNRHIGADCANKIGIYQIKAALSKLGINTNVKKRTKRNIYSLHIYGKHNLKKFKDLINFLHPSKKEKLNIAVNDFVEYDWKFPETVSDLKEFVVNLVKSRAKIRKSSGIIRIISNKENNLLVLQRELLKLFNIESKVNKCLNGIGTIYYELSINKKGEVAKLINAHLLNKVEEEKWLKLKK
jgi:hypothetical protein